MLQYKVCFVRFKQLPEAMEPYADYNKLHSDVEMDFAYREGLFARNVFSVSKTKPEAGDAAASDSPSEVSTRTERTPEGVEDDEDNSNRKFPGLASRDTRKSPRKKGNLTEEV